MTDKEQKKWHEEKWGENEEPEETPAERPHCDYDSLKNQDKNFNENYSQNKEQIIIDGVDVSGCESYNPLGNYNCGGCRRCEERPDCYFKQLVRKTQECEQKDERIIELTKEYQKLKEEKDKADKTISDLIGCVSSWEEFTEEESKLAKDSSIADLVMLLRERTQDYKNYKKQVEEFYKHMDRVRSWITQAAKDLGLDTEHSFGPQHFTFAVKCLKEEKEKLKQECEEQENKIKKLRKNLALEIESNTRYRKALEEIEGYAKENDEMLQGYHHEWANNKQILEIINKAKGEEDERNGTI